MNGKCVVHIDDNFDGRIKFSDFDRKVLIEDQCLAECKKTRIENCHYSSEGLCVYQLHRPYNEFHKNVNCTITSAGTNKYHHKY